MGAQHVLSLPRLHIQFSTMFVIVACFFFMIAWSPVTASEHAITTARCMTSIFSVRHPSSCRVGKRQSRGVLNMSLRVFRSSEKCFVLRFLG